MGYRYFALIGPQIEPSRMPSPDIEALFRGIGMQHRFTSGAIKLFASVETPTLLLPDGGIVLGHLFRRDGSPVVDADGFPDFSRPGPVRRYVLANHWGEYILVQPSTASQHGQSFLRDPSGGVSCVYSLQDGSGFVTSDISLAIQLGLYRRRIDWDYITHCLSRPNLKTQRTGLSGIRELLPGNSLTIHDSHVAIDEEWSPWTFVAKHHRHSDHMHATSCIRETVACVVKAWAETDRTILLELSGGLDSSIMAACLKDLDVQTTCCTLELSASGASERGYAEQMAGYLGVDLQVERLGLDDAKFEFRPPLGAVVPCISALQYAVNASIESCGRLHGVNGFFTGGGGDTVFCSLAGAAPAADAFLERGIAAGATSVRDLSTLHQCTLWKAGRLTLRKLLQPPRNPSRADSSFLNANHIAAAQDDHPWFAAPIGAYPGDRERIADLAGTQVFRDDAPRATTKWLRMPLLSQPVVEESLKVPTWMAISDGRNRSVARAAFSDVLPAAVLNRGSKASFTGYLGAVYQRHKKEMLDFLLTGRLHEHGLLDAEALDSFVASTLPLRGQSFVRIGELCMIENWVRHQD